MEVTTKFWHVHIQECQPINTIWIVKYSTLWWFIKWSVKHDYCGKVDCYLCTGHSTCNNLQPLKFVCKRSMQRSFFLHTICFWFTCWTPLQCISVTILKRSDCIINVEKNKYQILVQQCLRNQQLNKDFKGAQSIILR